MSDDYMFLMSPPDDLHLVLSALLTDTRSVLRVIYYALSSYLQVLPPRHFYAGMNTVYPLNQLKFAFWSCPIKGAKLKLSFSS